jgi:hypothetical protein
MLSSQKNWRLLLLLTVLLASGLRLYQVDDSGFWLDEGLTPLRSGYDLPEILSNRITIQDGETKDTHPPLHYLLVHFSRRLFGESDLAYRMPSVYAGVLLVPLLFQLARQMEKTGTALFVALLAAVNPLQIWYAQEARMYTLLVLFSAAGTFTLWRALTEYELGRWLGAYSVCAALAFYTHYTAIFLIGAQSLFWIWLLWKQGRRRLLLGTAILGGLIMLPLIPYTVPRIFGGAEASYSYVSPIIMLQDTIHGFGLGRTMNLRESGVRLLDVGAGLVALAGLIVPSRKGRQLTVPFLLTYLLSAVIGLMIGSLIKPMYMGVRHIMVGSPAFLLLLARGLALPVHESPGNIQRTVSFSLRLAGLGVVLVGPLLSLGNLYCDPEYAKDNVRALVEYIDRRAGGNDLVLYNDAILMTLQWHYQQRPDLEAIALPIYPHSAGDATIERLEALSSRFDRIWFIGGLPADGRDSGELVKTWLNDHLTAVDTFSAHGHNLEVKVTGYSTAERVVELLPAGARAMELRLEKLPVLHGTSLGFEEPAALPTLWLDLFWSGGATPPNRQLRFALRGPDQGMWLDHSRPFLPDRPATWSERGLVRSSYPLPVPPGTPPGEYDLLLQSWDKEGELDSDEWQYLTQIQLADSGSWPLGLKSMMECSANRGLCGGANTLHFTNGMSLLGMAYGGSEVRPGHPIPLTLYWSASTAPEDDVEYSIQVLGPGGEILRTEVSRPGADWLKGDGWPLGTPIREETGIFFPADAEPGRYKLRWSLSSGGAIVKVRPAWRPWHSEVVTFGEIVLEAWPLETDLPAAGTISGAQIGQSIELYGFDLEAGPLEPGGILDLTLIWRTVQVPNESYYVFVHLVRTSDRAIVSQLDRVPVDWLRPTNGWRPGEVLEDRYLLSVPEELTPGTYALYTGMFDPDSWLRPPIMVEGKGQPDAQLLLATWYYE